MGRLVRILLPHTVVILSGLFIILTIADRFNPTMGFINNDISKALLLLLCVLSTAAGALLIRENRRSH